jgi:hypothetical protein
MTQDNSTSGRKDNKCTLKAAQHDHSIQILRDLAFKRQVGVLPAKGGENDAAEGTRGTAPFLLQRQKVSLHKTVINVGRLKAIDLSGHEAHCLRSRLQRGRGGSADVRGAQERTLNHRLQRVVKHHVVSDDAYATLDSVEGLQKKA